MGYYVRVLSASLDCLPARVLESVLKYRGFKATLIEDEDDSEPWTQLVLRHLDGTEIASIERNVVEEGSLGAEELSEFAEEVGDCEPASAAEWLQEYFSRVRCIYAFQVLHGADHQNGWEILGAVKERIWSSAPAILQADHEGFSNEDGYHILWQFSDSVEGNWWMGLLRDGEWKHFQMNLGNHEHRAAFCRGEIPKGVALA